MVSTELKLDKFTVHLCQLINSVGTREVEHVVEHSQLPVCGHSTAGGLHLVTLDIDQLERKLAAAYGTGNLGAVVQPVLDHFDSSHTDFIGRYRISELTEDLYWRLIAYQVSRLTNEA